MNFDTGEEMNKEGFDIYNAEDVFFNDKCTSFSNSSLDIVLKDRRKDYYKDVNLCESGCKYEGINYTTSKVNCNCSILEDSTDKSTSKGNFNDIGASLLESTNIGLFKCIVQATSIKSLQSIGFYFCGSITIIQIILAIIFFINGFSKILINFSIQSIPQMQIINQKDTQLINTEDNQSNEIDIVQTVFEIAITMDHRNALYVFRDLMLKQLEIINMFRIGDYELYPISISLFLFSFASDFTMNAILFSDDIISQRYQNKGSLSLVTTLILTLLSNIIGFIISVIPSRLSNFSFALQYLKNENKKNDFSFT